MNRRDMFKFLPLFGVPSFLDFTLMEPIEKEEEQKEDILKFHGFDIRWSGFLKSNESDRLTGFWTAWADKRKSGFYSCTGGICSEYYVGHIFNICVLEGHHFLTTRSTEKEKNSEKAKALQKLKEEIETFLCIGRIV